MTAEVKGLSSEIELVASDAPGSDALRAQNPLGKIRYFCVTMGLRYSIVNVIANTWIL